MSDSRNWVRRSFLASLVPLMMAVLGLAQSDLRNVQGLVTDSSGAVIPAITVEAVDANGTSHKTQTNEEGRKKVQVNRR